MTDPIADYLTRLRNAISAKHKVVEIPSSNLKKNITKILFDKGYILNYKFVDDKLQGSIKIALKYHAETKQPAIRSLETGKLTRTQEICEFRRTSQGTERSWHCHRFHFQRCDDR